jgi:DNA-binding protein H-NS
VGLCFGLRNQFGIKIVPKSVQTQLRRDSVKTAANPCRPRGNKLWRRIVKNKDLKLMSADELWILYEEIRTILSEKLDAEKQALEHRLAQLNGRMEPQKRVRRPYPKVHPKYSNPDRPSETWSGRGKQPHWVEEQLKSGKKVDDLLISRMH